MNTNERSLRNASWSACRTLQEERRGARDAGRDVAEDEDLGPARAPRPVLERRSARRRSGARRASCGARRRGRGACGPCSSWPWVASRRLSCATTRWTARGPGSARSAAHGRARSAAASAAGSRCARSASRSSSRRRCCSNRRSCSRGDPSRRGSSSGRSGCGSARRPSARRIRWTSTPSTPEPSPRPKAAIASRARSRIAAVRAVAQRLRDLLAQRVEVDLAPRSPLAAGLAVLADLLARRLGLGGAEEEAVEHELEDAPVLRRLRERRGERLLEVRLARSTARARAPSNASSISEVPIATPSSRRSSANASSWPSKPAGGGAPGSPA